ncbi:hypothetical protein EDB85DRAFT_1901064 [Lactarius pseudohatsudake]|nr:hypothetical protein EDB85DRAFT_1901064 [Lactarius pseudohatsudake]
MKTVLLKKMCDVWRWKLTLFDAPPTTHAALCQVATPSFHLHRARPSRSSRIVPCVARALALLLAERKIDLKGMRNDEPGSATNRGLEESVMKELEQRQKAEGKQLNLARSVVAKDATGDTICTATNRASFVTSSTPSSLTAAKRQTNTRRRRHEDTCSLPEPAQCVPDTDGYTKFRTAPKHVQRPYLDWWSGGSVVIVVGSLTRTGGRLPSGRVGVVTVGTMRRQTRGQAINPLQTITTPIVVDVTEALPHVDPEPCHCRGVATTTEGQSDSEPRNSMAGCAPMQVDVSGDINNCNNGENGDGDSSEDGDYKDGKATALTTTTLTTMKTTAKTTTKAMMTTKTTKTKITTAVDHSGSRR